MSRGSRLLRAPSLLLRHAYTRTHPKPPSFSYRLRSDYLLPHHHHHGSSFTRRHSINAFLSDLSPSPSLSQSQSPIRFVQRSSMVNNTRLLFSTSPTPKPDKDVADDKPKQQIKTVANSDMADMKILRTLAGYLWMRDNPEFRFRVITALGFLVGAKVLNVQVPFLFKLAVDWLGSETGSGASMSSFVAANPSLVAAFATPSAVLIGYGIARTGASAFNGITLFWNISFLLLIKRMDLSNSSITAELRTAVFSKVALRTIRSVSRKVWCSLFVSLNSPCWCILCCNLLFPCAGVLTFTWSWPSLPPEVICSLLSYSCVYFISS